MSNDNTKPTLSDIEKSLNKYLEIFDDTVSSCYVRDRKTRRNARKQGLKLALLSFSKDFSISTEPTKPQIEAACQAMIKAAADSEYPADIAKAALIAASECNE